MAKDCYVKKYKKNAENGNMRFLNDIRLYMGNSSGYIYLKPVSGKEIVVRTYDGSAKIAASQEDMDNDVLVSRLAVSSGMKVYFKKPNTYISISDKYNLEMFGNYNSTDATSMTTETDLNDFKYYSKAAYFKLSKVYGGLENLYNMTPNAGGTWPSIRLEYCNFVDDTDLNKIGFIKALNTTIRMAVRQSNLRGSIEGIFANYRKAHPEATSGQTKLSNFFSGESTVITFNGIKIYAPSTGKTWSWVPNSNNSAYTDITDGTTTITVDEDGNKVVS